MPFCELKKKIRNISRRFGLRPLFNSDNQETFLKC